MGGGRSSWTLSHHDTSTCIRPIYHKHFLLVLHPWKNMYYTYIRCIAQKLISPYCLAWIEYVLKTKMCLFFEKFNNYDDACLWRRTVEADGQSQLWWRARWWWGPWWLRCWWWWGWWGWCLFSRLKRAGNCNKGGKFDQGCSQIRITNRLLRG